MFEWATNAQFWLGLAQIVGVNIILSGDNAIVIALAARTLPPAQQRWAILLGTAGAIVLRVLLTAFAAVLLDQPWLRLAGSLLLLWISIKLLLPEEGGDGDGKSISNLAGAVRTIIAADLVMSLDNVLGVAAAANGSLILLTIGLVLSMPLIIFGSTVILKLMGRFPWIITFGGALLGYVAGEMGVSDQVVKGWVEAHLPLLHTIVPIACAVLVVVIGKFIARKTEVVS